MTDLRYRVLYNREDDRSTILQEPRSYLQGDTLLTLRQEPCYHTDSLLRFKLARLHSHSPNGAPDSSCHPFGIQDSKYTPLLNT